MDSRNCQTLSTSPAKPGGLLRALVGMSKDRAMNQLLKTKQRAVDLSDG